MDFNEDSEMNNSQEDESVDEDIEMDDSQENAALDDVPVIDTGIEELLDRAEKDSEED